MGPPRVILGVNVFHGDSSAALIMDGELVAAVEQERYNRQKHSAGVPYDAIAGVLKMAGVQLSDVDAIAVGRDNRAHRVRKAAFVASNVTTILPSALRQVALRRNADSLPQLLSRHFGESESMLRERMVAVEHHRAHLASAYYLSGWDSASVISLDGFGDFVSTMWATGSGSALDVWQSVYFPHSLGVLYQAVTQYIGFPKYGDEGKIMGLAPYGEPRYLDAMHALIRPAGNGRFVLNSRYFIHTTHGVDLDFSQGEPRVGPLYTPHWQELFGRAARSQEQARAEPLDVWTRDMAASVQQLCERYIMDVVRAAWARDQNPRLCLAGGVALNSVANGKIADYVPVKEIYVQPAAGDDGIAIGAAAWLWRQRGGRPMRPLRVPYTGPRFTSDAVAQVLLECGCRMDPDQPQTLKVGDTTVTCRVRAVPKEKELCVQVARLIADEKVVGWFHGRMEFGPRALGARSILADPRSPRMKDILNQRIKHREIFRPFAPSVLAEHVAQWFEKDLPSPAMLMVYPLRADKRAKVPAITHVDGTGRLQTVTDMDSPRYARLIREFYSLTGVPMVLNTSFNENEPIVHTPLEALHCFARTRMDVLVLEDYILERS